MQKKHHKQFINIVCIVLSKPYKPTTKNQPNNKQDTTRNQNQQKNIYIIYEF
jgi:hypothetical protein